MGIAYCLRGGVIKKIALLVRGALPAMIMAASLAVPGIASAELTQGSATDPVGDSLGAPSQDIVSAHVTYDSNGSLTVSATMNGNIAEGPASFFGFGVASYSREGCGGNTRATLSGFSTKTEGVTALTGPEKGGYKATGIAHISVSGKTIVFSTSHEQAAKYANKSSSFSRMFVAVGPDGVSGKIFDELNPLLRFEGFGPTPTPTTPVAPTVSAFASTVAVKLSTGTGTLTARCGASATESCTFSLTLFATVKNGHASSASKVNIGTVTGKLKGGKSGALAVKLNMTGREFLKRGTIHPKATGTVKNTRDS